MPPAPPGALTTVQLKPLTWNLGPETLEEQPRMASCLPCGRRPALRRHLRPHLRGGGRMLFLSCCRGRAFFVSGSYSRARPHSHSDTRTRVHPCTYVTRSHSCSRTHTRRRMTRARGGGARAVAAGTGALRGSSSREEPEHNSPQEPCPQPPNRAGSSFLP